MSEDDIKTWLDEILEEIEGEPGTNEYLEVVERAEKTSKQAEGLAQISRNTDRSLSLKTQS